MSPTAFTALAQRILLHPAVPYHEAAVRDAVEEICAEHELDFSRDSFGNVLVRLRTDPRPRPFVLAAHLDHPGFEMVRSLGHGRWHAQFLGGVPDHYFRPGLPVRLMPGAIPARLGQRRSGEKQFEIIADSTTQRRTLAIPAPRFAVWELPDFTRRGDRIIARSCDDLIGVTSILATLIDLKRQRTRVNVIGVISRAEETGFHGALTVAASKQLPKDSLVVSLETSKEIPPVKMGQGMIIRVGDRTSVFDSAATRFLTDVAAALAARDGAFQFQRALMSGGTCEATAYQEFGFQTAAVCVALGHYHNCAPRNRIAAEFVSLDDACGMVRLLTEAAKQLRSFDRLTARLPARLNGMVREARRRLRAS